MFQALFVVFMLAATRLALYGPTTHAQIYKRSIPPSRLGHNAPVVARHTELRAVRDLHGSHERAPGRLARRGVARSPSRSFSDDDQALLDRDQIPATAPSRAPASNTSPRPAPRGNGRRRRGPLEVEVPVAFVRSRATPASARVVPRPRSRRRAPGQRPNPRRRSGPPACFRRQPVT